jgi:hypothetical protein
MPERGIYVNTDDQAGHPSPPPLVGYGYPCLRGARFGNAVPAVCLVPELPTPSYARVSVCLAGLVVVAGAAVGRACLLMRMCVD